MREPACQPARQSVLHRSERNIPAPNEADCATAFTPRRWCVVQRTMHCEDILSHADVARCRVVVSRLLLVSPPRQRTYGSFQILVFAQNEVRPMSGALRTTRSQRLVHQATKYVCCGFGMEGISSRVYTARITDCEGTMHQIHMTIIEGCRRTCSRFQYSPQLTKFA